MSRIKEIMMAGFENSVKYLSVYERETYIEVSILTIKDECRNQGIASTIMKRLVDYADSVQKPILLSPEVPEGEKNCLNLGQLINFYEKFDFRPNKGKNRDYSMLSHSYKRNPI